MKNEAPIESSEAIESGDAVWRERRKLAKNGASWPWTVGLGVVALGWGAWTRLEWQSRQHPLTLRVLRQAAPGDGPRDAILDIQMPDAPPSSEERFIEGPIWSARISRMQFRSGPDKPWAEVPPQAREDLEKRFLAQARNQREGSGVRSLWVREQWFGAQGSEHKIEAEVRAEFLDDSQHLWSGSAQTSLNIVVPTPTMPPPTKAIAGIDRLQYAPGLVSSKPNPNASGGQANAAPWRDLPAPGQKGFPAIVEDSGFVSLRVVQRGRKPGDAQSFAPLTPRWNMPSRDADSWQPGLDFSHLPMPNSSAGPGGVYKRIEVKVEAQDHEIVRGVSLGQVREGEKWNMTGWILVRPKSSEGQPIPLFDTASASE